MAMWYEAASWGDEVRWADVRWKNILPRWRTHYEKQELY